MALLRISRLYDNTIGQRWSAKGVIRSTDKIRRQRKSGELLLWAEILGVNFTALWGINDGGAWEWADHVTRWKCAAPFDRNAPLKGLFDDWFRFSTSEGIHPFEPSAIYYASRVHSTLAAHN